MSTLKRASRCRASAGAWAPARRRSGRAELCCEPLEHRRLLSTEATASSLSQITAQTNFDVIAAVSTGPTGLTPQQIRDAYGINLISFSGGAVSGTGAGETIAIVDAYNDPEIASRPRRVRSGIWPVRPAVFHDRQPGRHDKRRRLVPGNVARRRVGARHRPAGQHHSGRIGVE